MADKDNPEYSNTTNYFELAKRKGREAKESERTGKYQNAIEDYQTAARHHLELAKNSPEPNIKIRLLNDAVGEYEGASRVIDKLNELRRTTNLIQEKSRLSEAIRSIANARDILITRQLNAKGKNPLEGRILPALAIITLLASLVFISMNMTGNAIGGSPDNNSGVSIGLFFLGCVFAFLYFRMKGKSLNKKKSNLFKRARNK